MSEPTASSSNQPLVSVIIPTFNRADVIAEAIDSALGQEYPNIEVIVVDDGSSDGTSDVAARYAKQIVFIRQRNAGYGAARNTGLRASRGKYVAWLDSDDIFLPHKTMLQVSVLERDDKTVLVSSDFEAFGSDAKRHESVRDYYSAFREAPRGAEGIYSESGELELPSGLENMKPVRVLTGHVLPFLLHGSFVHPPTVMMRRTAALLAGDLDESLRNSIEYDFFFRLAPLGKFAFIDAPLIRYRFSSEQLSGFKHTELMAMSVLKVVERLPQSHPDLVQASSSLYRRRLAECHVDVAYALGEQDKKRAWSHWIEACRHARVDPRMLRVLVRLSLPTVVLRKFRAMRHARGGFDAASRL